MHIPFSSLNHYRLSVGDWREHSKLCVFHRKKKSRHAINGFIIFSYPFHALVFSLSYSGADWCTAMQGQKPLFDWWMDKWFLWLLSACRLLLSYRSWQAPSEQHAVDACVWLLLARLSTRKPDAELVSLAMRWLYSTMWQQGEKHGMSYLPDIPCSVPDTLTDLYSCLWHSFVYTQSFDRFSSCVSETCLKQKPESYINVFPENN